MTAHPTHGIDTTTGDGNADHRNTTNPGKAKNQIPDLLHRGALTTDPLTACRDTPLTRASLHRVMRRRFDHARSTPRQGLESLSAAGVITLERRCASSVAAQSPADRVRDRPLPCRGQSATGALSRPEPAQRADDL